MIVGIRGILHSSAFLIALLRRSGWARMSLCSGQRALTEHYMGGPKASLGLERVRIYMYILDLPLSAKVPPSGETPPIHDTLALCHHLDFYLSLVYST